MFNPFTLISKIKGFFVSGKARATMNVIADATHNALPYVTIGAELIAGITPTQLDDVALRFVKTKYPALFDGSIKNGNELKDQVFLAMADALKVKYPILNTSEARAAMAIAVAGLKADRAIPTFVPETVVR